MRVPKTMAMVVLGGVLFAVSVSAECELGCEGVCRQVAKVCQLDAALEAKAGKVACANEHADALVECHAGHVEMQEACVEMCGGDFRACKQEASAAYRACVVEAKAGHVECKLEAAAGAAQFRAECFADKGQCLEECAGPDIPDGGGLS